MTKTIAILATLDTKGAEAAFLRDQLRTLGSRAILVDLGVVGEPGVEADVSRQQVAEAAGTSLGELLREPTREKAAPVMVAGATELMRSAVARGEVHAILGLGGLQGTAACTQVMRSLPYGLPKIMVSTVASGDTAPYVDIKDVTMMFSVGDVLGLNPVTRKILANAAGAAHGMALIELQLESRRERPVVGMTNLGVLTRGAMHALSVFEELGCEAIVFHAVGSGGRAMEQMMREGLLDGVFDYALGEIADELFGGLRAGGPERLTVAGKLGLPQVIVPGGAEHLGILVDPPNTVPDAYRDHTYVFHNPVVFVPRLHAEEIVRVAADIAERLRHSTERCVFMLPLGGTGSYAAEGGPLRDESSDRALFQALRDQLPETVEIVERPADAEDPEFVREAVERLVAMIRAN